MLCPGFSIKKLRIIARFAKPNLKNGTGFGIANSTAEKKRHKAVKKVRRF